MNKISFYFSREFENSRSTIYNLIDKILQSDQKVFLYSKNISEIVDKEMWTFSQQKFMPHLMSKEISNDFDLKNTSLIIFDKFEIYNKIRPDFLIFLDPDDNYLDFIKSYNVQSVLVFYSNDNFDSINIKSLPDYEQRVFQMKSNIWSEIKTRN